MKFKQYLEKYIDNPRAIKEWQLMQKGYMPLTPSILKDFEIPVTAYHVTSVRMYKNLVKLQKKRKDIPCFTKGSKGLSLGAWEDTELLLKLKGYSSFESIGDLSSILDRNGHRWISTDTMKNSKTNLYVNNNFTVPINKKLIQYFNLENRMQISNVIDNLTQKGKQEFIKFYYDSAKELITQKLLKEVNKTLSTDIENSNNKYTNNEILLHNFEIVDIKIVASDYDSSADIMEKMEAFFNVHLRPEDYVTPDDIMQMK